MTAAQFASLTDQGEQLARTVGAMHRLDEAYAFLDLAFALRNHPEARQRGAVRPYRGIACTWLPEWLLLPKEHRHPWDGTMEHTNKIWIETEWPMTVLACRRLAISHTSGSGHGYWALLPAGEELAARRRAGLEHDPPVDMPDWPDQKWDEYGLFVTDSLQRERKRLMTLRPKDPLNIDPIPICG